MVCDLQTLCSILFAEEDFSANGNVSAISNNSALLKNVQISCICKEMSVIASTLKRRQKLVKLSAGHYTIILKTAVYPQC